MTCRNHKWRKFLWLFFDVKGNFRFESIPQGQIINQAYCVEIHKAVGIERPELLTNDWILYHDSAPDHKALSVKQFLPQKSII